MEAKERTIGQVLTEAITFDIPPYQRPYSWEVEQVQDLLNDVLEAYEDNEPEYFIGSLITIEKERNVRYEVVDGQQRLTTLNLIFCRLRDHITDATAKQELSKRVLPSDALTGRVASPRLMIRRRDQAFFRSNLLEPTGALPDPDTIADETQRRFAKNALAIDEFLKGREQQWMKLFANFILTKVYIVFVQTSSFESAYRMFNVLNDRGMSLSNADLIKNRLFGRLEDESRSEELEERWVELEGEVGQKHFDTFLNYHRVAKEATKAKKGLAEEYEGLLAKETDIFRFLDALIRSAGNYRAIMDSELEGDLSIRYLNALHRVSYDEWVPALLAFLNKLPADMTQEAFLAVLEKITMQNWVRRLGRTKRNTIYYRLIQSINNGGTKSDLLAIAADSANNTEFFSLLDGDIYGLPSAHAILLRLEEAMQDGSVTKTFTGRITIEHVLPQALKESYWKKLYTAEAHQKWLHRLGNLTLLSGNKNYKAQYFDFDRKKKIYNVRGNKVSFDMTKAVCRVDEWSEAEIDKRQKRMVREAKELWTIEGSAQ